MTENEEKRKSFLESDIYKNYISKGLIPISKEFKVIVTFETPRKGELLTLMFKSAEDADKQMQKFAEKNIKCWKKVL